MADSSLPIPDEDHEAIGVRVEKRGCRRRSTTATFKVRLDETIIEGAGRDVSSTGAYMVSSDDMTLEVCWEEEGGQERKARGRIVRVDRLPTDTFGIAIEFDAPQKDAQDDD